MNSSMFFSHRCVDYCKEEKKKKEITQKKFTFISSSGSRFKDQLLVLNNFQLSKKLWVKTG